MPVINLMETVIQDLFDQYQKKHALKCNCSHCKEDILALVLNRMPPKYVSSHKGEVYIKTFILNQQLQMDVMKELIRAVKIVEENPRHR